MSFLKEYNIRKKWYKYGVDYLEYKKNGYLLFIPLSRSVLQIFRDMTIPTFTNYICEHNCIIHHCYDSPGFSEYHFAYYVHRLYREEKYYKGFLINLRKINYEKRAGIAFTSFNFNPYDNGLKIKPTVYDGAGHYYNMEKINKEKYFKGTKEASDKEFYRNELSGILTTMINGLLVTLPGLLTNYEIRQY